MSGKSTSGEALPPPVQGPTAKEKRYDRQLRLWGAAGQMALEKSHILLINSGPGVVGVEALKNLVLPGIGNFTIQDTADVTEADLGVNFFLQKEHIGEKRAKHTCNLLKELNPDVEGNFITNPVDEFLADPDALSPYTLILVTAPIRPQHLETLSAHATRMLVPLIYIHSVGFYSQFSIHLPPIFPVVETHPSSDATTDLRLLKPWPELLQFAADKTKGLDEMAADDHGHIPFLALLLHFLEQWRREHDGKAPENYSDKTAFRTMLGKAARTDNPEGGEENFDEATAAVLKTLNFPELNSSLKEILKEEQCVNPDKQSAPFWVIAHAIARFVGDHGVLPVPGAVPDMKARSADYIELQNVYKSKARKDQAEVVDHVRAVEREQGRTTIIDEKDIEAFCKNAAHIKLVRGRPLHVVNEIEGGFTTITWGDRAKPLAQSLTDPDSLIHLYIAFLAFDRAAFPGKWADKLPPFLYAAEFTERLTNEADFDLSGDDLSDASDRIEKSLQELLRADGGELHNISALTGGMVAQEVIKIVTEQYIPVDNTCIFDGVRSMTSVLRV